MSDVVDRIARKHREILLQAQEGDLIEFPRDLYSHWGVYVGRGRIIHLSGEVEDMFSTESVRVRDDDFWDVAGTSVAKINNLLDDSETALPGSEIVARAREKLEQNYGGYDLIFTNCEHFATWCRYNKAISNQVKVIDTIITGVGAALKKVLTQTAESHPDESKRAGVEGFLAIGEAVARVKDAFVESNRSEQLKGLTPRK